MGKNVSFSRLTIVELALIELIVYTGFYLWNAHIGFLLCLTFAMISGAVLIISYVADFLERSKVPSWYYRFMWVSIVCPLVVISFFSVIDGFDFLAKLS